jgi:hypothetical protein
MALPNQSSDESGDSHMADAGSAITGAWAWGNSVDPKVDSRGVGESAMSPSALADFAREHLLSSVYLSVPWAADQGAIALWLTDTVDALHSEGVRVGALGGDPTWLQLPDRAAQWITDAGHVADFDTIELDLEPWVDPEAPDYSVVVPQFVRLLRTVNAASPLPVGLDLPWWLAAERYEGTSVFSALAREVDSVAIVTFSDHAEGPSGIVALAQPATLAASDLGKDFTIGVETDTPLAAGGSQFTFFGRGQGALESAASAVAEAFAHHPEFCGVTVEHVLSWRALAAGRP